MSRADPTSPVHFTPPTDAHLRGGPRAPPFTFHGRDPQAAGEQLRRLMYHSQLDELGGEFLMLLELVAKQVERMRILLEKTDDCIIREDHYGGATSNLVFCADQLTDMEDWIRSLHDDGQLRRGPAKVSSMNEHRSGGGPGRETTAGGGGAIPMLSPRGRRGSLMLPRSTYRSSAGGASPIPMSPSNPAGSAPPPSDAPTTAPGANIASGGSVGAATILRESITAPLFHDVHPMPPSNNPSPEPDKTRLLAAHPTSSGGDRHSEADLVCGTLETDPMLINHSQIPSHAQTAENVQQQHFLDVRARNRFGLGFLYSNMSFDEQGFEVARATSSFAARRKKTYREPVITRNAIHWLALASLFWQILSIGIVMICSSLKIEQSQRSDGWLLFAMLVLIVFQIVHVLANITIMYKIGNQIAHLTISFELLLQSYLSLVLAMAGTYFLFSVVDFEAFAMPAALTPKGGVSNSTAIHEVFYESYDMFSGLSGHAKKPDLLVQDPGFQALHFLHMLYFSCTVMTGCGFGDITPRAWYAVLLVTLQQLLSVTFATVICGLALQHFTTRMHLRKKALEERRQAETANQSTVDWGTVGG